MTHDRMKTENGGISTLRSGSNISRVREHNERLVLSLIRHHQNLSRADIARLSGLSAQTVTVIIRSLEGEGFLLRGTPIKGRIGQPSIPMRLNPEGAFSVGLKVGRRSAELVLVDFLGQELQRMRFAYHHPITTEIQVFATDGVQKLVATLPASAQNRIAGIGIAIPFELWNWGRQVGAPAADMQAWRDFDLSDTLQKATGYPVYLQNDATAACGAELALGRGREFDNFCYFFLGFFIGGGIVLNNAVFYGPTGNAGAMGSMPLSRHGPNYVALLDETSIFTLEENLRQQGQDPTVLWHEPRKWNNLGDALGTWESKVAENLSMAIASVCAVIDFETIIIDGSFPADVRDRIVERTGQHVHALNLPGLSPVKVVPGKVGANAPAMGGAILPILSRYFINQSAV